MESLSTVDLALIATFLIVFIVPFRVKIAERNLEAFLLLMGGLAVTISGKWATDLVLTAVEEPVARGIVPAVLVAGLVFFYGQNALARAMKSIVAAAPLAVVVFGIVVVLGLASSVVTAIIAALLLVEVVSLLPLDAKAKTNLVVIACFSIGLGAVLTPLGEPLSTIAVAKLSGPPHQAGFWYLFEHIGIFVVLGVIGCGFLGAFHVRKGATPVAALEVPARDGGLRLVFVRAIKVYAFVAALFLLGAGVEPIIDQYFALLPNMALFWLNMVSAILDNATLTAAEIVPTMSQAQINAVLLGLLISGGMLIPGNIPNIISANKFGITSAQWARIGVPLGLAINAVYFVAIFFVGLTPKLSLT